MRESLANVDIDVNSQSPLDALGMSVMSIALMIVTQQLINFGDRLMLVEFAGYDESALISHIVCCDRLCAMVKGAVLQVTFLLWSWLHF
jgi:hypothetical protein